MVSRFDDGTTIKRGSQSHRAETRKMMDFLENQQRLGAPQTLAIRKTLSDGTELKAEFAGKTPLVTVKTKKKGGSIEEIEYLYVGSTGGLKVFDMGTKTLVNNVTGLENFRVQDVDVAGNIVWMTGSGASGDIAARIDLRTNTAFGYAYSDPSIANSWYPIQVSWLSPDQTLIVHAFSVMSISGSVFDGAGGVVLADAETLAPVRPHPIRMMSIWPHAVAWSPDSQYFYVNAAITYDPQPQTAGDLTNMEASDYDYIAKFDRTGTLVSTAVLTDNPHTPGFHYGATSYAISPDGTRLYATVEYIPGYAPNLWGIQVYDITGVTPVLIFTLPLTVDDDIAYSFVQGEVLYTFGYGTLAEYTIKDALGNDTVVLKSRATNTPEWHYGYVDVYFHSRIICRQGPNSRFGAPRDPRKFRMDFPTAKVVLTGYASFQKENVPVNPVYTFDLTSWVTDFRFAIANVGSRIKEAA